MTIDLLKMGLTIPIDAKLNDGSVVQLAPADERDVEPLRRLRLAIFGALCESSSNGASVFLWRWA